MQANSFTPTYFPSAPYQPQLPVQRPSVMGRMVADETQIAPSDVPMDGSVAFFPLHDLSRIYAKQWTRSGTIETVAYVPVQPEAPQASETIQNGSQSLEDLAQHLDSRLDDILAALTKPASKTKNVYRKTESGEQDA